MTGVAAGLSVAETLVSQIEAALKPSKLVGAYLYGSLVHGDYIDGSSDIDLLALVDRALDPGLVDRLGRFHVMFESAHPAWSDRIEVQYVPAAAMRRFKDELMEIAVISPGEAFHTIHAGIDWTQNWYDVRENGRVMRGPIPSEVIPPISVDEFIASIRGYVSEHVERARSTSLKRGTQAYSILTLCRAAYTCETGRQISKSDASVWARTAFPRDAQLIDWASAIRRAPREEQCEDDETTIGIGPDICPRARRADS